MPFSNMQEERILDELVTMQDFDEASPGNFEQEEVIRNELDERERIQEALEERERDVVPYWMLPENQPENQIGFVPKPFDDSLT